MNEDLTRSDRSTARGGMLRRRARFAPGPLRPASCARAPRGVVRGMLTGALLGLAVLIAFTLPFLRAGGDPAAPPAPGAGPGAGFVRAAPSAMPVREASPALKADEVGMAAPGTVRRPESARPGDKTGP